MNTQTVMTGLFGDPVQQSMSPSMHNAAFQHMGLNYAYAAFAVPHSMLRQAVEGIRALSFRGVNVTIPHKVAVMEYLDEIDDEALAIGAVNTIVNEQGKLIGYNTDGTGYVRSLLQEMEGSLAGKRVVILGAGGAARAVGVSLAHAGIKFMTIANRSYQRAEELAHQLSSFTSATATSIEELERQGLGEVDLLINTTSVGMYPNMDSLPISEMLLHAELLVSDLIYNPLQTKLLSSAKKAGARTHNGIGMFVQQGALAFERWTGQPAPTEVMREVVLQQLSQK